MNTPTRRSDASRVIRRWIGVAVNVGDIEREKRFWEIADIIDEGIGLHKRDELVEWLRSECKPSSDRDTIEAALK